MPRHRRKRMALERRDHRVDIGPAGRNHFYFPGQAAPVPTGQAHQGADAPGDGSGGPGGGRWGGAVCGAVHGALFPGGNLPGFLQQRPGRGAFLPQPGGDAHLRQHGPACLRRRRGPVRHQPEQPPGRLLCAQHRGGGGRPGGGPHCQRAANAGGGRREDGLALTFSAGYVSYEEQERLFEEKVPAAAESRRASPR